jgi:Prokaryotic homologs of the JAB domain
MKSYIRLEPQQLARCKEHLLPRDEKNEQGAFLFAETLRSEKELTFNVVDFWCLEGDDWDVQEPDFLELADNTRARIIKYAHDTRCSLIEVHSHPGPIPACFSIADIKGFYETVPNMMWRLKGAPYAALVFAEGSFDALVWSERGCYPTSALQILTGQKTYEPTQLTYGRRHARSS